MEFRAHLVTAPSVVLIDEDQSLVKHCIVAPNFEPPYWTSRIKLQRAPTDI